MLNPFPELLTYSMLAPFILRVIVGLVFIDLGILIFKGEKQRWVISFKALQIPKPEIGVKILGVLEIVCGAIIFVGLYTQIGALILAVLTLIEGYLEYRDPSILKRSLLFYVMLCAILLSLLFSGAGAFAFDIPL